MTDKALKNGLAANEGFQRCMRYTHSWLEQTDPATGLILQNVFSDTGV
jgi:hypothetical protein